MRWAFEMVIGAISDQKLYGFLQRLRGGFGIAEYCSAIPQLNSSCAGIV